jgi:hypothetical protein
LTAASPVLPSEDPSVYQEHHRRFFEQYQPANATESQFVQELADTSWRLNRIPLLEAQVHARAAAPVPPEEEITFDIVDAHRLLGNIAILGQRLSRQYSKALDKLREIQAERRQLEERELRQAAAVVEFHKHKGIPYDPAEDGFVFSMAQIEQCAQRLIHINESRNVEYVRFYMPPPANRSAATSA